MKVCLTFLLLLLQACIIVPVPAHRENGRIFIQPEMIAFVKPDSTTREQVLLQLGDPDGVLMEQKIFYYKWFASKGYMMHQGGAGSMRFEQFFLIGFNDDDTVHKLEIFKRNIDKSKKPIEQFATEWYNIPGTSQ
jgi:outer membrane protein assembly factor BamE (lipoprotein component of BamABCDE complex)